MLAQLSLPTNAWKGVKVDAQLFGLLAAALLAAMAIPQLYHTLKTRETEGVSLIMWAGLLLNGTAWVSYGLHQQSWVIVVGNILYLATVFPTFTLALADRRKWPIYLVVTVLAFISIISILLFITLPIFVCGTATIVLGAGCTYPQVLTSFSRFKKLGPSAVSKSTILLLGAGQSLWLIYGFLMSYVTVIVANILAITAAVVILLFEILADQKAKRSKNTVTTI